MAEQHGEDKYIKCSKCKCKYINDDNHIKNGFGYNRLNERFKTCTKCRTKKVNINTLPDALTDKIYQFKHNMEFQNVMDDIKNNIYVYGDCPKCKFKCDDEMSRLNYNCDDVCEMPCWLDTLSELRCNPEWVMNYGRKFKNDNDYKNHWYTLWKTGEYVPPKIDMGYYGWLDDFNDDSDHSN